MAATTHLPLRDTRDRLIDMLGIGHTFPLRDLAVRDEQLTVAFNSPAKIPVDNSQVGVLYQLHDDGQPVERAPDESEGPGSPIQVEGNGATVLLETYRIQEDITFEIYARKIRGKYGQLTESGLAAYLHQTATVKVGLDSSLRAWIREAPSLDPAISDPNGTQARIIFYEEQVDVEIENSQEGVDYHLVLLTPTAEELALSDIVRGDLGNIILRSQPLTEDVEIRIRATKTFDSSEDRETETDLLEVTLPLRVRANPDLDLSLDPAPVIGFQQQLSIKISGAQDSALYQLFGRPIRDRHFYPQECLQQEGPQAEWVKVTVPGEQEEVLVCRPPREPLWAMPDGFISWGEPLPGNGGKLEFEIEGLEEDHLFLISAQKLHRVDGETEQKIPSQVQLLPAAAVLTEPDPDQPLKVRLTLTAEETYDRMLVMDGQPGVYYHFHLDPEGDALGLPAYFHQRDESDPELNKGVGQLGVGKDFAIARGPVGTPTKAPLSPLLDIDPLPGGATLSILAKKAMTRVSVPLTAGASISPLPQIRLQDPILDYDRATKIQVLNSLPGDRYQPWLAGSPLKKARLGNGGGLSFNTDPLKNDTTFQMRVTRPDDAGIPVERVLLLHAVVRPNAALAVSAADAVVLFNGTTVIQVESSQPAVHYQLIIAGQTVGQPLAGSGETISLPTGPLAAKTTFVVRASKAFDTQITVDLAQQATVQVLPDAELPLSAADASVAINEATEIRVETSQLGVSYQLLAAENPVGEPVVGSSGTISLPTGPLTAETIFAVRAAWSADPAIALNLAQTVTVEVRPEQEAPIEGGDIV